jgi:hypothetical protein
VHRASDQYSSLRYIYEGAWAGDGSEAWSDLQYPSNIVGQKKRQGGEVLLNNGKCGVEGLLFKEMEYCSSV